MPRDGNREPVIPIPDRWRVSRHLGNRCGSDEMAILQTWWERIGVPACSSASSLQCISGLHLYLDFFFETKCEGLVIYRGRWYGHEAEIPGQPVLGIGQRAKGFMYAIGKFFGENRFLAPKKLKRPHTAALSYWSLSYRLRWPQERLDAIDNWLLQKHRKQLTRVGDLEKTPFCASEVSFVR